MYVGQRDTVQPSYQTGLASWLRRRDLGHVLVADRFVLDANAADAAYVVQPSVTGVREDSEGLFRANEQSHSLASQPARSRLVRRTRLERHPDTSRQREPRLFGC